MVKKAFSIVFFNLIIVLLLAVGCQAAVSPTEAPTASAIKTTPTATAVPFTATVTKANTATPKPSVTSLPSSTFTPTATMTPTASSFGYYGPIAYVFDEDVYLMDPSVPSSEKLFSHSEGSNYIGFTDGLSWSPDGQYIVYNSQINPDIFVYSIADSKTRNLTNLPENFEQQPDWSPDGKKIVFTGDIDRKRTGKDGIYVMNADGSGITRIRDCDIRCMQPDWSPSGKYIAYVNQIDGYTFDLYVMNADGTNPVQFAHGGFNLYPAWSPDGSTLAFTRSLTDQNYIYLINADGSGRQALTDDSVNPRQFSWSADGKYIVFDNFDNGPIGLRVLDVASGNILPLTTGGAYYSPEWSPYMEVVLIPEEGITMTPSGDCTNGWTRLAVGGTAQVMGNAGGPSNNVRSEPAKADNIIGKLPPGTQVSVLEGPVCASGLIFWKVKSVLITDGSGWTAEGDGTNYYLQPGEEP